MTASPTLQLVTKEIRALGVVFAASFATLLLSRTISPRFFHFAEPAYLLGTALLGGLSIGHEYSHGTIAQMLAQPVCRAQLLLTKLAILAVMLAALGAAAWFVFIRDMPGSTDAERLAFLMLPILVTFGLAPWLTMVGRSAISGVVFAFGLPGLLWSGGLLVYYAIYRAEPSPEHAFAAVWRGAVALSAVGAVMTWRMFLRLEAREGRGREIELPRFGAAVRVARRRSPLGLLVAKDVRLQQMTLAITALYCVAWPVCVLAGGRTLEAFYVLSILFAVLIAMLSGALASAEERHLGTFETQLLLPIDASTQWLSKVAVTLTLTLAFGIGLPALFTRLAPSVGVNAPTSGLFIDRSFVTSMLAVACGGLYVSTLSSSGVRAVVTTAPSMLVYAWLVDWLSRSVVVPLFAQWRNHTPILVGEWAFRATRYAPDVLVAAGLVVLIALGFQNHRSGDRSVQRIAMQVCVLLAFAVVFTAAMTAMMWMRPPITPFRR